MYICAGGSLLAVPQEDAGPKRGSRLGCSCSQCVSWWGRYLPVRAYCSLDDIVAGTRSRAGGNGGDTRAVRVI